MVRWLGFSFLTCRTDLSYGHLAKKEALSQGLKERLRRNPLGLRQRAVWQC